MILGPMLGGAILKKQNLARNNLPAFAEVTLYPYLQSGLQVLVRTLPAIFDPDIRVFIVAHVENNVFLRADGELATTFLGNIPYKVKVVYISDPQGYSYGAPM
jgi:hypothetical protein